MDGNPDVDVPAKAIEFPSFGEGGRRIRHGRKSPDGGRSSLDCGSECGQFFLIRGAPAVHQLEPHAQP